MFTNDEMNFLCIYHSDSRQGCIDALTKMRDYLAADEIDLHTLTDAVLCKLNAISDEGYNALEMYPDFDE